MMRLSVIIFFVFIISSQLQSTEAKYNIPLSVFLIEGIIPGGGHVYNNHLDKALYSFTTTALFFGKYIEHQSNYINFHSDNKSGDYLSEYYDRNKKLRYKALSGTFLTWMITSYFDSFIDAYSNLNKNNQSDFDLDLGIGLTEGSLKTFNEIPSSTGKDENKSYQSPKPLLQIEHGTLIGKKLFLSPDLVNIRMDFGFTFFERIKLFLYNRFYSFSNPDDPLLSLTTHDLGIGSSIKILQDLKFTISYAVLAFFTSWEIEKAGDIDKMYYVDYGNPHYLSVGLTYRIRNHFIINFLVDIMTLEDKNTSVFPTLKMDHRYFLGALSYRF